MLDPTARALRLLSLLQTHRFWPGYELAAELDVSARTLRRDVDRLRNLGYTVDATTGSTGGYRLAAGAHMPPLLLDDDEAIAIAVGLRSAAGAAIAGIEDTAVSALAKLEQVLPDRLRRRVSAVHANVQVLRWRPTDPGLDAEVLATLSMACRDREEIRFDYERRDGERSSRLVQPAQLVAVGRRWYLVAWDVRRTDWRTFRADRLTDLRLAGARFDPRPLPADDAAAFVAQSLRSTPMPHRLSLVVHLDADRAAQLGRWIDADTTPIDVQRQRLDLRSETEQWLVSMVAIVAVHAEFELDEELPDDVGSGVAVTVDRLRRAAQGAPAGHVGD